MSSQIEVSTTPRAIFTREDSEILSIEVLKFIMAHLEGKKSPTGEKWAPYSESYKKHLTRLGESTVVDFSRAGRFLSSLRRKVARRTFTVGIVGEAAKDEGYIAAHERRPFIGLSLKETDKIINTCVSLMLTRWKRTTKMMAAKAAVPITGKNLAVNRGDEGGAAVREALSAEMSIGSEEGSDAEG